VCRLRVDRHAFVDQAQSWKEVSRPDKTIRLVVILSCETVWLSADVDREKFHLVAPYVLDPDCWLDLPWTDQHSGTQYEITTEGFHGSRGVARVKTYGEVFREYEFHPGAKSADAKGKPSGKQTFGLLRRRHVRIERIIYIGKESNRLEEIYAGLIHSPKASIPNIPTPDGKSGRRIFSLY